MPQKKVIALGPRLRRCRNVITLGVHTNFSDYSKDEIGLIRQADKIYYPTLFYAGLFDAIGKITFPSYHTYTCALDKIKQSALFALAGIPHPETRIFYGKNRIQKILNYFRYPFIAKIPRKSSMGRGVFLVQSENELSEYLNLTPVAYIQKQIHADRDARIVIIGGKVVHAYWRIAPPDNFKTNIASGGSISLEPVPDRLISLALNTARTCSWDDVGIDIISDNHGDYILEANIRYGRKGFSEAGIDYPTLMESLIENGDI